MLRSCDLCTNTVDRHGGEVKIAWPRAAGYPENRGEETYEKSIPWHIYYIPWRNWFWCFGVSKMPCSRPNGSIFVRSRDGRVVWQLLYQIYGESNPFIGPTGTRIEQNQIRDILTPHHHGSPKCSPATSPDQYQSPYESWPLSLEAGAEAMPFALPPKMKRNLYRTRLEVKKRLPRHD